MAEYTMTLGDILKSGYQLWDFNYPCIAGYRATLEMKFNLEFYDREINFLSVDEFKRHLIARFNMIMPYYVQLQKSERLINNPFTNYKMAECTDRKDDEKTFFNTVDTAAQTDGIKARTAGNQDVGSQERVDDHSWGTEDGTLDRDTTDKEKVVYDSQQDTDKTVKTDWTEDGSLDRDTTDEETTDMTSNQKTVKAVTSSDTDTGTDTVEKTDTVNENTTGYKQTLFADTPQENFVIGEQSMGRQISAYATTVTDENTTGSKDGTQTGKSTETRDLAKSGKEDTDQTFDQKDNTVKTGKGTQDDVTKTTHDGTETTTQGFTQHDTTDKDAKGTVDDITHGEHEDTEERETKFNQNTKTHEESATDRLTTTTDLRKGDRLTKSQAITAYGYEGYKHITESQMLKAFRDTFINIDRMIFNECETLFLGIY